MNEYVEDGFLVDDDAPIEYETQFTQSSSLNMPTLVSTRDSLFPYSDNEDSGRSHRRQGPSIQQIEREEREAQSVASHRVRRRKRAMVLSDEEDSIEDEEPVSIIFRFFVFFYPLLDTFSATSPLQHQVAHLASSQSTFVFLQFYSSSK